MDQLQWEARQMTSSRDEWVQRYIEEKDDPTVQSRQSYRELKRELNMFRHYHFTVTYTKVSYSYLSLVVCVPFSYFLFSVWTNRT